MTDFEQDIRIDHMSATKKYMYVASKIDNQHIGQFDIVTGKLFRTHYRYTIYRSYIWV